MRSTGSSLRSAVLRIASGLGPSNTQNVFVASSLTYECIHVTPSSALRSTTPQQLSAPFSSRGTRKPSGNVRSTMYRGILTPPWRGRERCATASRLGAGARHGLAAHARLRPTAVSGLHGRDRLGALCPACGMLRPRLLVFGPGFLTL